MMAELLLTHGYFLADDPVEQRIMKPYPPLGLLYLSAYLEQHGIDHELFDTTFSSMAALHRRLLDLRPPLLGIYANLLTRPNLLALIAFVRSQPALRATRIVLGGPEVRYHIDQWLQHGADVLVLGEGEQTLLELVTTLKRGGDLATVAGLAYRGVDGGPVITAEREAIRPLDSLPEPARERIDIERYATLWRQHHGMSAMTVSTMRGCPYSCRWCSRAVYGRSYRRRSPTAVVAELEALQRRYAPDSIWFVDDVFTIHWGWLAAFADELERRGLVIAYECITRADRLDEPVVALLKRSGCYRVWIGAESGSQAILDAMERRVTVAQVQAMMAAARRAGIEVGTFVMLGYPGEREADIEATLHHLKATAPDHWTVTLTYPITGTPLHEQLQGAGLLEGHNWASGTERDQGFVRTYSQAYYQHALRWLQGEMAWHRLYQQRGHRSLRGLRCKLSAWRGRWGMWWARWRS